MQTFCEWPPSCPIRGTVSGLGVGTLTTIADFCQALSAQILFGGPPPPFVPFSSPLPAFVVIVWVFCLVIIRGLGFESIRLATYPRTHPPPRSHTSTHTHTHTPSHPHTPFKPYSLRVISQAKYNRIPITQAQIEWEKEGELEYQIPRGARLGWLIYIIWHKSGTIHVWLLQSVYILQHRSLHPDILLNAAMWVGLAISFRRLLIQWTLIGQRAESEL